MKKIMLTALWTIDDTFHEVQNLVHRNKFDIYKELNCLSTSTFKKHHPDWDHETILINKPFKNHHLAFFHVFKETYRIWKENKGSTILFHDVDSICNKNLNHVLGQFDHFMCFGIHHPTIQKPQNWHRHHHQRIHLSCSLRLFPKEMKEEVWELGFKLWKEYFDNPNNSLWAIEQDIYNEMVYQNKNILDYQNLFNINDVCSFRNYQYNTECHVYQYYGTRDIHTTLQEMRKRVLDESKR